MRKKNKLKKGVTASVWVAYVFIVFEILYMISPFAFYYYSIYATPLRWLQESPLTSWLTANILPHFTFQKSIVISTLNLISWPLIIIGMSLFLIGFIQIYWAKFRKKGNVTGGLYNFIRHPQYVALAIVGLGTTIYWSRFIVLLMYATMLFLYYYLAKQEEKICLQKFGESYMSYYEKTGMFLPRFIESRLPRFSGSLPKMGMKRVFLITGIYFLYICCVTGAGFLLKDYALSKTTVQFDNHQVVVSVAPLEMNRIQRSLRIVDTHDNIKDALSRLNLAKKLIYILPAEWGIPELGIQRQGESQNYLLHPETHGNSLKFNADHLTVLITAPVLLSPEAKGMDILKKSLAFIPHLEVCVDLNSNQVVRIKERVNRGKWDGIPVPVY